jgi:hypothetical protein
MPKREYVKTTTPNAYQLVKAGLAGGKGVPETVAGHPRLLVTFTAPSFGPVHSSRVRRGRVRVCRPARPQARCPHGQPRRCSVRHLPGDPALGVPLCVDCYDHERAVVWNALAPELWRRTTIYLSRALARLARLARLAGLPAAQADGQVRVAYAKSPSTRCGARSTTTPSSAWTLLTPIAHRPPGRPWSC